MANAYTDVKHRLRVPNPYRPFAAGLLVVSAALIWVAQARLRAIYGVYQARSVESVVEEFRAGRLGIWADLVAAVFCGIALADALVMLRFMRFLVLPLHVPPKCPFGFDGRTNLPRALQRCEIPNVYHEEGPPALKWLRNHVSERYLLMTEPVKLVAGRMVRAVERALDCGLWLVLSFLTFWFGLPLMFNLADRAAPVDFQALVSQWFQRIAGLPIPWNWGLGIGIGLAALLAIKHLAAVAKRIPSRAKTKMLVIGLFLAAAFSVRLLQSIDLARAAAAQSADASTAPAADPAQPAYQHVVRGFETLAHAPFPTAAWVVLLMVLAVNFNVLYMLIPPPPPTDVHKRDQLLRGCEHPDSVYIQLQQLAEGMPPEGWVMSHLLESPKLQGNAETGSATASGAMVVENQPEAVDDQPQLAAYAGLLAGLCFIAWGLIHDPRAFAAGPVQFVEGVAAQLIAVAAGAALIERTFGLLSIFRFKSLLIFAQFSGPFGVVIVTGGNAGDDSFKSKNYVLRGDLTIRYYGAEVISECLFLVGARYIVEIRDTEFARQQIERLARGLEDRRRSGVTMTPPDFADPGASKIMQANATAELLKRQALSALPAAAEQPVLPPGQTPPPAAAAAASPTKRCPDCAEVIQLAARKCRFCGSVFDAAAP